MSSADPWSSAATVRGFATGPPNGTLVQYARGELAAVGHGRALDIGCGAGRNAVPLAVQGWDVLGLDRSRPMLVAATERARDSHAGARCHVALASMDALPVASRSCQLIVAHGIWNLARSAGEFRAGVRDAARAATHDAALFLFTFSRSTFAPAAEPVAGESFVFSGVSGQPNVFLTREQLIEELAAAGFHPDPALPLAELNARRPGTISPAGPPVIWQGGFRLVAPE